MKILLYCSKPDKIPAICREFILKRAEVKRCIATHRPTLYFYRNVVFFFIVKQKLKIS